MQIHHPAIWTHNLEKLKDLYTFYFQGNFKVLPPNKDSGIGTTEKKHRIHDEIVYAL